jgi:hypothetical protein
MLGVYLDVILFARFAASADSSRNRGEIPDAG